MMEMQEKPIKPRKISGSQSSANQLLGDSMGISMAITESIIHCLGASNVDIQRNSAAFLQHKSYHNEDNKEFIRIHNGIPALLSLYKSSDIKCQMNSAGVLRNMSHGENMQIKKQMKECGIIEAIAQIISSDCLKTHPLKLLEYSIAIVCNISGYSIFHPIIFEKLMDRIINFILLPYLNDFVLVSVRSSTTNKKSQAFDFNHCPLMDYLTALLRNMSSGTSAIRQAIRSYTELMVKLTEFIALSSTTGHLQSKSVENIICSLRNLSFSLYTNSLAANTSSQNLKSNGQLGGHRHKKSSIASRNGLISANANGSRGSSGAISINSEEINTLGIWSEELVELFVKLINDCSNYHTVEAAIGCVQNLAAGSWFFAQEFRFSFRKKKGLPSLVIQMNNGPDRVIRIAVQTLRNLAEDSRNLELIGSHCLLHLLKCLPNTSRPVVKRPINGYTSNNNSGAEMVTTEDNQQLEYLSLDTIYHVLALIYYVLINNKIFSELVWI